MPKKLTYEFVKVSFELEGYRLLSKEYVNSSTKLEYRCPVGHFGNISWNNWNQKHRCKKCFYAVHANIQKYSLEFIELEFEKEGYLLLSDEYINNYTKLEYICSNSHKHKITWGNWKQGKRCPTCKAIKLSVDRIGSNNPQWKGGISFEPYCEIWSDKEYKNDIRERDGYRCLNPYCFHNDGRLHVHHVDFNKKNCGPGNLITLCGSCNSRANKNRKWHTKWYRVILNKRYGYVY